MECVIRERFASERISNRVFFVPFAYYFRVRLGTMQKLLSWMLLYLMPTAFYMLFSSGLLYDFSLTGLLQLAANYLLTLVFVFNFYETGYIHNDTFATLREQQPAIRLYPYNLAFFYRNAKKIFLLRFLYSLLAGVLLVVVNGVGWGTWRVLISGLAVILIFLIYNYWRTKWNVLLYPVLVYSRFLPFILLYSVSYRYAMLLFLVFPFVAWLERFSMPSHRFAFMKFVLPEESSKTLFRVEYYLLCIIILHPVYIFLDLPQTELLPFDILLLYRVWLWLYLKTHTPENYLQG